METPPTITRFVEAIVRAERARGGGANEADVALHLLARLHQPLGKLIGPAGFDVLVARSLVLARQAHPVLAGVAAGPRGTLARLDAAPHDGVALGEGVTALVCRFVELLVALIGEDIAMSLVRDAWPAEEEDEDDDAA